MKSNHLIESAIALALFGAGMNNTASGVTLFSDGATLPEFVQQIAREGLAPAGGPPERLMKLLTDEVANWARVARQLNLERQ